MGSNLALSVEADEDLNLEQDLRSQYTSSIRLIERLHRLMLDVIKSEFDRLGIAELNSVQASLLNNIGDEELTAGELKSRGYYLGSNASYNLKKLVDLGYIDYQRSDQDRRSVRIKLTEKGRRASDIVDELYTRQLGSLEVVGGIGALQFRQVNASLNRLERYWIDQIRFRL